MYLMVNCAIPMKVIGMLERIFKSVIWGHETARLLSTDITWGCGVQVSELDILHFLPKAAGHLILNDSSLWSSMVVNKYNFNGSWESCSYGRNVSTILRVICCSAWIFQHELQLQVGSVSHIKLHEFK